MLSLPLSVGETSSVGELVLLPSANTSWRAGHYMTNNAQACIETVLIPAGHAPRKLPVDSTTLLKSVCSLS